MEKFKISLAAARVNAKMTQEFVAKSLGISKSTVVSWEKGKTSPKASDLKKMCELYCITMDYIFLPDDTLKVDKQAG